MKQSLSLPAGGWQTAGSSSVAELKNRDPHGTEARRGENRTAGLLGDPGRRITGKSRQEGDQGTVLTKVSGNPRESNLFQRPQ